MRSESIHCGDSTLAIPPTYSDGTSFSLNLIMVFCTLIFSSCFFFVGSGQAQEAVLSEIEASLSQARDDDCRDANELMASGRVDPSQTLVSGDCRTILVVPKGSDALFRRQTHLYAKLHPAVCAKFHDELENHQAITEALLVWIKVISDFESDSADVSEAAKRVGILYPTSMMINTRLQLLVSWIVTARCESLQIPVGISRAIEEGGLAVKEAISITLDPKASTEQLESASGVLLTGHLADFNNDPTLHTLLSEFGAYSEYAENTMVWLKGLGKFVAASGLDGSKIQLGIAVTMSPFGGQASVVDQPEEK